MLITDGVSYRPDAPEVSEDRRDPPVLSAAAADLPLYPWIDVAPDGRPFCSGPSTAMLFLDPSGTGAWIRGRSRGDSSSPKLRQPRAL